MKAIENTIRAIFPSTAAGMVSCGLASHILERDKGATFTSVDWTNGYFMTFDPTIAKDMTSFFSKYKAPEVFRKDCDGVMIFEENDKRYLFLTELKSSFDTTRVCEAKTQLLSSYLKINMLLNLTQGWKNEGTIVKGFIVSPAPNKDKRAEWKRDARAAANSSKRFDYSDKIFCGKLLNCIDQKKPMLLHGYDSHHLAPCRLGERGIFPEMELHYVEVPAGQTSLTLDARQYL